MAKTKTDKSAPTTESGTDIETPEALWKERFQIASSEQTHLFEKFKDWFDVMYATRSTKSMAPWRSKIYIPILASKAWDFITRLSDVVPKFDVTLVDDWFVDPDTGKVVFDEDGLQRCIKIARKLQHDFTDIRQDDSPADAIFSTLLDATVTGTGVVKVGWATGENTYRAHEIEDDGKSVDTDNEIEVKLSDGFNYIEPVNIFNVFPAPNSDSLEKAPWIIIREFKTLEELEDAGVYDNLDLLTNDVSGTADKFASYNYARNRLLNSQDRVARDKTVKFFEIFECHDAEGNIKTFVGNASTNEDDWLEIRDQPNPFWHGKKALQAFYIRRKPYSFWGESLFENNESLQYAANDVLNHYMDNLNLALDGGIMMDENAFVEDYVVSPGFTLFYKNEKPDQFKFPEPNPAQLSTVLNNLEGFVESATVPAYSGGVANSQVDKTQGTATGVSKIMEAADSKLGFMRSNFKKTMRKVGIMWLCNAQQFMDSVQVVSHQTGNLIEPMMITPADLQGRYKVDIDDESMTPTSKSEERANFLQYVGQLLAFQKASNDQANLMKKPEDAIRLNYNALTEEASMKYGVKNFGQFLLQAPSAIEMVAADMKVQVAQSQMMQAALQSGQLAPPPPPPPRVTIRENGNLSPDQNSSVLQRGGYGAQDPQQMAQTASQAAPTTPGASLAETSQTMANPGGK